MDALHPSFGNRRAPSPIAKQDRWNVSMIGQDLDRQTDRRQTGKPAAEWRRIGIGRIEDLSDAVYGAGLEATQMSVGSLSGSLVFAEEDGVVYTSGLINGQVALSGPLSQHSITLGAGLRLGAGCWHWLTEVGTGDVGIFHAGDEHDSFYTPGSLYATATLSAERLEEEAAKEGLLLDRHILGGTGVHPRQLPSSINRELTRRFQQIHFGDQGGVEVSAALLRVFVDHLGRPPIDHYRRANPNCHAKIVERARSYILENLAEPISLDAIAAAAYTSRRTLYRAFGDLLDDTPQNYVRRLRLHRIRNGLAGDIEKACTITTIANQWGISELGRLSGCYRELFGERPSETLAQARDLATGRPHKAKA
jgi:AraC-like DNA-binding protein